MGCNDEGVGTNDGVIKGCSDGIVDGDEILVVVGTEERGEEVGWSSETWKEVPHSSSETTKKKYPIVSHLYF